MRYLALVLLTGPAFADPIPVPSGQPVELVETLIEPGERDGPIWRFRFLAPQIARASGTIDVDTALADIDAICTDFARIQAIAADPGPSQIVITLMDRIVPFGQAAPQATQYIEAYKIQDQSCVWEPF